MEAIWTGIASGWKSKQSSLLFETTTRTVTSREKSPFFAKSTLETVYFNGILLFKPSISAIALRMI